MKIATYINSNSTATGIVKAERIYVNGTKEYLIHDEGSMYPEWRESNQIISMIEITSNN